MVSILTKCLLFVCSVLSWWCKEITKHTIIKKKKQNNTTLLATSLLVFLLPSFPLRHSLFKWWSAWAFSYFCREKYSVLWIQEKKSIMINLRPYYVRPSSPLRKESLSESLSRGLKNKIVSFISEFYLWNVTIISLAWNSTPIKAKVWFLTNCSVCQEIQVISTKPFTL